MDVGELIDILRAYTDPHQRETAEKQLEQVHKIIGFAPSLLQVVMTGSVEMPVRQAGAIYLKNLLVQFCQEKEPPPQPQPLPFHIHEQDRAMVCKALVGAMVHAPELIRVQLSSCLGCVLKSDFPGRWMGVVYKVIVYLQSPESASWAGALLALYTFVKNYKYKPEEQEPLREAMQLLLSLLQQRLAQLLADQSETSVLLQKLILKIYSALVQYHFPLGLISRKVLTQWMELLAVILFRPVPDSGQCHRPGPRGEMPPDVNIIDDPRASEVDILAVTFEEFGNLDSAILPCAELGDDEIVCQVLEPSQMNSDSDDDAPPTPQPSSADFSLGLDDALLYL
ncbi:hypothetical protein HPB49_007430 [Dermacentor silvarum]|uniref:Uncharacterized protein n=1 Tax=Dermacentor silvarum TaxID=543639 RepID=A0ACB8DXB9_DERSI|nr:hypothetical protein HPB49_007430 [Dermacentor silvarum]